MIPGTSLVDWENGEPNARYRALKLLVDSVRIGDVIAPTITGYPGFPDARVYAQAFAAPDGSRTVVLINKRGVKVDVEIGDWNGTSVLHSVDVTSGDLAPTGRQTNGGRITLEPHATAVLARG